jgi:formylglycine-generating enzyme required for sulfatase activity
MRQEELVQQELTLEELAERQIRAFEAQYEVGEVRSEMSSLLLCVAFPMTLTTDLVCCLRENFVAAAPWYGAMDVVVAGFVRRIGYDLYELDGVVRRVLLRRLRGEMGQVQLLEQFMVAYVAHRLEIEAPSDRSRVLGDEQVSEWTALFCAGEESAVVQRIRERLRQVGEDRRDRLYWISMLQNYQESILPGEPLLQMVQDLRQGRRGDEAGAIERALGITLRPVVFTTARLRRGAGRVDPNARQQFDFATVRVDRQGRIVQRQQGETWGFVELLGNQAMGMVAIPGGEFVMGSPEDEPERYGDEGPPHRVKLSPFFMGRYAVTQAQWRVVASWAQVERELEPDPSEFKGADHPVENVTWLDAVEFCARLSRETGRDYGLPSEAEWEYACRSGTTTAFNFGEMISPEVANYDWDVAYDGVKVKKRQKEDGTMPVGTFAANGWGLYEMHGNVWEWCADDWHGDYEGAPIDGSAWRDRNAETASEKVIRGGSWIGNPRNCRSAIRISNDADSAFNYFGFRVVCRPPRTL